MTTEPTSQNPPQRPPEPRQSLSVVMLGATGAVGTEALTALATNPTIQRVTTLNRRPLPGTWPSKVAQVTVDPLNPDSYAHLLAGHDAAICTLGVGEPTKAPRADFIRIDKDAPLAFARACRAAGVAHFELLSSVASDATSRSFFLRTKGELNDAIRMLGFARVSIFQPSMILTPTNRYGLSQAITLAVWPWLTPVLAGPLTKYRGIEVARLGTAIAANVTRSGTGNETLHWSDIDALAG